jgi:hypothetical protein
LVSDDRNTVSGATSVTPPSIAALRRRCCNTAAVSASCVLVLIPRTSSSSVSITVALRPIPRAMATASVK